MGKVTLGLLGDLCRFKPSGSKVEKDALMLYGERDEFFRLKKEDEAGIMGWVPKLRIKRIPNAVHNWPLYEQERAADEIMDFLEGK